MHTLILLRHGKAVREHEAPSDRARGLTGRGRKEATDAGAALLAAGLRPDFALVSSAQRTRESAQLALRSLPPLEARVAERLYLAAPEAIWAEAVASGGASVLVIGHNPGLQELVQMLVAEAHDNSRAARLAAEHFPTSAWAAFEVRGDTLGASGARFLGAWSPAR